MLNRSNPRHGARVVAHGVLHRHRAACLQQWRSPVINSIESTDRVWSMNPLFWSAGFAWGCHPSLAAPWCWTCNRHGRGNVPASPSTRPRSRVAATQFRPRRRRSRRHRAA